MSKFDELTDLAKRKAQEFSQLQADCTQYATKLVAELRESFGASGGSILCGEALRAQFPRREVCSGEVPDRLWFDHGYWYFHLRFVFTLAYDPLSPYGQRYSVGTDIGVAKKAAEEFTVVLDCEDGVDRGYGCPKERDLLFDYLFEKLKKHLAERFPRTETLFGPRRPLLPPKEIEPPIVRPDRELLVIVPHRVNVRLGAEEVFIIEIVRKNIEGGVNVYFDGVPAGITFTAPGGTGQGPNSFTIHTSEDKVRVKVGDRVTRDDHRVIVRANCGYIDATHQNMILRVL